MFFIKKMLAVIVSLGLALSACGKRKPEALTQLPVGAVSSSTWEWPCNHPWITLGAVIAFVSKAPPHNRELIVPKR